jgi:hypothetical protein
VQRAGFLDQTEEPTMVDRQSSHIEAEAHKPAVIPATEEPARDRSGWAVVPGQVWTAEDEAAAVAALRGRF